MNLEAAVSISKAWVADKLYVVVSQGTLLYVESPEEAMIDKSLPQESVIRTFVNFDEAERYRDTVKEYTQIKDLAVRETDLQSLFTDIGKVSKEIEKRRGEPVRLELCSMAESEWARTLDVLWTAHQYRH